MIKDYSDVTVIVPTLNEEGNIGKLIETVTKLYKNIQIIISDDGSKDKTLDVVKKFRKKNKRINFIDRSNKSIKGLTISVIDGIMFTKSPIFVVIDGDLQHPPEKIKEIVESIRSGTEVAIGCREKISSDWPWYRLFMSQVAILMGRAKLILKGKDAKDIMSGFFGSKTELIQRLIKKRHKNFKLRGYKILFDILDIYPRRMKIKNIYYEFNIRKEGKSKIGNEQIVSYVKSLFRL